MIPDPVFNTIIYILVVRTVYICNKTKQALGKTKLLKTTESTWLALDKNNKIYLFDDFHTWMHQNLQSCQYTCNLVDCLLLI